MHLRVLVADDDRGVALSIQTFLRRAGNEVQVAFDGEHAILTAQSFQPDVLILDIGLPDIDGLAVAKHLRHLAGFEHKTFVALTAYADQKHKDLASQAQFDEYLVKPFRVDMMLAILNEVNAQLPQTSE